jgi:hypothetical protein
MVSLYELQIPQHGSGSIRHGDAVACSALGVRGLTIEPANSPCRQDRPRSPDDLGFAAAVAPDDSHALVVVAGEQVYSEKILQYPYLRILPDFFYQSFGDYPPGLVAVSVSNARMAVAALEGGRDPVPGQVELGVPAQQLVDQFRPLADYPPDHFLVAQSAAGLERIGDMRFERIGFVNRRGDPALGFESVAVSHLALADDDYVTVLGRFEGGAQTRYSGPYHQTVGEKLGGRDRVNVHQITSEFQSFGHCIGRSVLFPNPCAPG